MQMPVTISKQKEKGGAQGKLNDQKSGSFLMQMYMQKNVRLELLVSRSVYNNFMLSSKQLVSYLHHIN